MSIFEISTPAALIDEARLARNIQRMQHRVTALGATLRPHVKTSKCLEVVRRQSLAGARGITVSTLKEAEEFFDAGFSDIFYAVAIVPDKLDRALALAERGCALTLLVDSSCCGRRDRVARKMFSRCDDRGRLRRPSVRRRRGVGRAYRDRNAARSRRRTSERRHDARWQLLRAE